MTPEPKITFINPNGGALFAFLVCIPVGGVIAVAIAVAVHVLTGSGG